MSRITLVKSHWVQYSCSTLTHLLVLVLLLFPTATLSTTDQESTSNDNNKQTNLQNSDKHHNLRTVFKLKEVNSTIITTTNSSSLSSILSTQKPLIMSSTFRPSSAILYLHPPRPRHLESLHSELVDINFEGTNLTVHWKVWTKLRNVTLQKQRNRRQSENAKVEEESTPLRWVIHIRRYGTSFKRQFEIIDKNNTLDPPITGNQSYEYTIGGLIEKSGYELCVQSVNAGPVKQNSKVAVGFPMNALSSLTDGRSNVLFLCKEVIFEPLEKLSKDVERGRSSGGSIELNEETTDAFIVYTAISSGSTTLLLLIIISIVCCCRCGRKKEQHTLRYDRVQQGSFVGPASYIR